MRHFLLIPLAALLSANAPATPEIDYPAFTALTHEVAEFREKRLINLNAFNEKRQQASVIILDTRSAAAFAQGHIDGAINLPFSDFTDEKLSTALGEDKGREILIYCNNNFFNNIPPVALKRAPLALNIPTFINLYGYGYKNIHELSGSYNMHDPKVGWKRASSAAQ